MLFKARTGLVHTMYFAVPLMESFNVTSEVFPSVFNGSP